MQTSAGTVCSWVRAQLLGTLQELPLSSQLGWQWCLAELTGFIAAKLWVYLPSWIVLIAKPLALIKPLSHSHMTTHHTISYSH